MNLFFLDNDIDKAVANHNDSHIRKMPIEVTQILSTVIRLNNGTKGWRLWDTTKQKWRYDYAYMLPEEHMDYQPRAMFATHAGHPSTVWTNESLSNYRYVVDMANTLFDEYSRRYDSKIHRSSRFMQYLSRTMPNIPDKGLTTFPQAMFDDCKLSDTILAYQKYYRDYKRHLATWKTSKPSWYE